MKRWKWGFQALPTFLLGALLAAAVLRAGSLGPALVAHAFFNAVGLLLSVLVPPA